MLIVEGYHDDAVEMIHLEPFNVFNGSPNLPEVFVVNGNHPEAGTFRHQDQLLVGDEFLRRVPEQEVVPWQKID
jgi:hypothetical protein